MNTGVQVETIKSRIRSLQFKMNLFEEQLVIADDSSFRSHDLSEAFRIRYNQNIKEFFGKYVTSFHVEMKEICGKISLLPSEDKSTHIKEMETLAKMNASLKKQVDDLILNE